MKNYIIASILDVQSKLNDEPIMFDTETIGLYGKIRLAQFYQKGWDQALIVENPSPFGLVGLMTAKTIVMHSANYDISTIQENLGKISWMPKTFHCTLLLSRLFFYFKEKFTFDKVIEYVKDMDSQDSIDIHFNFDKKELQKSDWAGELTEDQMMYAANDVIALQDVWDVVKECTNSMTYRLDMTILKYCLDFQNNGLPLDLDRLRKKRDENLVKIQELDIPINVNSWQQVREYLGIEKSDAYALVKAYRNGNEKAKCVRDKRKLLKENSFISKYFNTQKDGAIYGKFAPYAKSGRAICKEQNLHQNPRSLKIAIGVDPKKEVLIYSDFAQLELRGLAVITADPILEKLYKTGIDIHSYTATDLLFASPNSGNGLGKKELRRIAKTANFGLAYGGGIAMFQRVLLKEAEIWLEYDEVSAIKKMWKASWPGISKWQDQGIRDWRAGKPWKTPLGRQYMAKRITDQMNIQIQGFGAEVTGLALHYMHKKLGSFEYKDFVKQRHWVHDAYIFTCPNTAEIYEPLAKIVGLAMQEAWIEMSRFVKIKDLPLPVEVRVGYNWGDIENDKYIYRFTKE